MDIIEQKKKAWADLYDKKEGALVFVNYTDEKVKDRYVFPYAGKKKERVAYALDLYEMQTEQLSWLGDDKIPYLNPYTGTEIFARAFGCNVYESGDNMPFALPAVNNSKEAARIVTPELKNSPLTEIFETADTLKRSYPDAIMALPDIQSPLDIAALIWSKDDFYAAMLEEPGAVKELIAMINALLTEFLDSWFGRYGTEFIAHYPAYYMPRGVTLSEDEIGAISPELFREFSLGTINALSDRYGGIGVHCCADSAHQWQNIKAIKNLKILNLCRPADVLEKAFPEFTDVCVQMHSVDLTGRMLETPGFKLSGRAVLQWDAASKTEASEICGRLREYAERAFTN